MKITSETPVQDIAVELPTAIPVLERFGIDYCCGGKHTLTEACAKRDLSVPPVLKELERQQQRAPVPEADWQMAPLQQLTDHIVQKHHMFTGEHLELIRDPAAKVERRHGSQPPEAVQLSTALASIIAELVHHFCCEENMLFPYIAQLDGNERPALPPVFCSVEQPVTRILHQHIHLENNILFPRALAAAKEQP